MLQLFISCFYSSFTRPISKVETLRLAIDYISKLRSEVYDTSDQFEPVNGPAQLVRRLPDEAFYPTEMSPCVVTPPPVYCFGGLVQHTSSHQRQAPGSTGSNRSTPHLVPIPNDTSFNFYFQRHCQGYTNNLQASSQVPNYNTPPPSCSFSSQIVNKLPMPALYYC